MVSEEEEDHRCKKARWVWMDEEAKAEVELMLITYI